MGLNQLAPRPAELTARALNGRRAMCSTKACVTSDPTVRERPEVPNTFPEKSLGRGVATTFEVPKVHVPVDRVWATCGVLTV